MAVPADLTTLNITGKYLMNKTLSDSTDEILQLQGVGWLTRKAISMGSLTLTIKHYKNDAGVEHIDIDQTLTGGIPGTKEERVLNWEDRIHHDHIFGHVVGKSKRVKVEDIEEEHLKKDWTEDTLAHEIIYTYVESDTPKSGTTWVAIQTWGFEIIDGVKRYTRHVHFTGPKGQVITRRLVYDYLEPIPES
ncbi:hypothetical protein HGRIS_008086 [Hohenbuehelia grisea]|uniref:Uncharacterized protein n=1 Tax=Hohenbuehelia grisea TaxID=104357 RepID=A0ABR3J7B4_9AGAR